MWPPHRVRKVPYLVRKACLGAVRFAISWRHVSRKLEFIDSMNDSILDEHAVAPLSTVCDFAGFSGRSESYWKSLASCQRRVIGAGEILNVLG